MMMRVFFGKQGNQIARINPCGGVWHAASPKSGVSWGHWVQERGYLSQTNLTPGCKVCGYPQLNAGKAPVLPAASGHFCCAPQAAPMLPAYAALPVEEVQK